MKDLESNKEWRKWGEIDPLFGVASWKGKNREGINPWTNEDFYKIGELDWLDFRKHWEMYGVNKENCLEIGCGAGRMTLQLASFFNKVHAIDISEKILEYAKKYIKKPNIEFYKSNGIVLPFENNSIYSVFSTHVFQHLDSLSIAREYLKEVARVTKPGGTLMIHLPIYKWPSKPKLFGLQYAVIKRLGDIRASIQRSLMNFRKVKPIMRGLKYPVEFIFEEFPKLELIDIQITMFTTKSNYDLHAFIFAKKI